MSEEIEKISNFNKNPLELSEEDKLLCKKLDEFYKLTETNYNTPPSEKLKGAIYKLQEGGPDYLAQSAHSIREIFYRFSNYSQYKRSEGFEKFGSAYDNSRLAEEKTGQYRNFFAAVAHHKFDEVENHILVQSKGKEFTEEIFIEIFNDFKKYFLKILRRQTEVYKKIDKITLKNSANLTKVKECISLNEDAKDYFFYKADPTWISWLKEKGFLDSIINNKENNNSELYYLSKASSEEPGEVTKIISKTKLNKDSQRIIRDFLRICERFSGEHFKSVVDKIIEDNWVKLLGKYTNVTYGFKEIIKKLVGQGEYERLVKLTKIILTVRDEEEFNKEKNKRFIENPFYFDNFSQLNLFEALKNINEGSKQEELLDVLLGVMSDILELGENRSDSEVFDKKDIYPLFDINLFSGDGFKYSKALLNTYRGEIKSVLAFTIELSEKLFRDDLGRVQEIFKKVKSKLPKTRLSWRIRMRLVSIAPEELKEELKEELFLVFETDNYSKVSACLKEYRETLRKTFNKLPEKDQKEYFDELLKYSKKHSGEERELLHNTGKILAIINKCSDLLTKEKKEKFKKIVGNKEVKNDPERDKEPVIKHSSIKSVDYSFPGSEEDWNESVESIVEKLKSEWSPSELKEEHKNTFERSSGRGVGDKLQSKIKEDPDKFIKNANLFFDEEKLHPHYTYSFLKGIEDAIKNQKIKEIYIESLFSLANKIKDNDLKLKNEDKRKIGSLVGWREAHMQLAEVLRELLDKDDKTEIYFSDFREDYLEIIKYLLQNNDPKPRQEKLKTAQSFVGSFNSENDRKVQDPFTMAINSVRGRAFQAFTLFVYHDGEELSGEAKKIYKKTLEEEQTKAIRFLFGHYFPSFYFRDKKFIKDNLSQIFPDDEKLFLAAWEGFLTNNLYEKIFFDSEFQELYEKGLSLNSKKIDEERELFKKPEEGIANHISLAAVAYPERFKLDGDIFKKLWDEETDIEIKKEFINFTGKMFISSENERTEKLLRKKKKSRKRLKEIWEKVLNKEAEIDEDVFLEFGSWMTIKENIFEVGWLAEKINETLKVADGDVRWDTKLSESISKIAEHEPEIAFKIVSKYLKNRVSKEEGRHRLLYLDKWKNALDITYNNTDMNDDFEELISYLLKEGGRNFWDLKNIIEND